MSTVGSEGFFYKAGNGGSEEFTSSLSMNQVNSVIFQHSQVLIDLGSR